MDHLRLSEWLRSASCRGCGEKVLLFLNAVLARCFLWNYVNWQENNKQNADQYLTHGITVLKLRKKTSVPHVHHFVNPRNRHVRCHLCYLQLFTPFGCGCVWRTSCQWWCFQNFLAFCLFVSIAACWTLLTTLLKTLILPVLIILSNLYFISNQLQL